MFLVEAEGRSHTACVQAEAAALVAAHWDQDTEMVMVRRQGEEIWWEFPTSGAPERQQLSLLDADANPRWVGALHKQATSLREQEEEAPTR